MKLTPSILLAAASLALAAGTAYADTRSSDGDKATMERKASPANPTKQDEEQAEAHGQPDSPHATGGNAGTASKGSSKPRKPAEKKGKSSSGSSSPSSANEPLQGDKERAFKLLDIDGDGAISKAEAAGHAPLVTGFDRADRNHDGKLSRGEYAAIGEKKDKARTATGTAAASR